MSRYSSAPACNATLTSLCSAWNADTHGRTSRADTALTPATVQLKEGINTSTMEGGDRVMVTYREDVRSGRNSATSKLLGILSEGHELKLDGTSLWLRAEAAGSDEANVAFVTVALSGMSTLVPTPVPTTAEGSCTGICGGKANSCFCDSLCTGFSDCCEDYDDVCVTTPSPTTPSPTTPAPTTPALTTPAPTTPAPTTHSPTTAGKPASAPQSEGPFVRKTPVRERFRSARRKRSAGTR